LKCQWHSTNLSEVTQVLDIVNPTPAAVAVDVFTQILLFYLLLQLVREVCPEPMGQMTSGVQGDPGVGVPAGGTTGQVLAKNSGTNYDTEWVDAATGGAGAVASVNGATGVVVLDQDDIADGTTAKHTPQRRRLSWPVLHQQLLPMIQTLT